MSLGSAMKMNNPLSRVLCVAMNGDEAVLSGGSSADMAIWFSEKTGKWVSSTYYKPTLPDWLRAYNTWVESDRFVNKGWMMLSDEDKSPARIRLRQSFLLRYCPREEGVQHVSGVESHTIRQYARADVSRKVDRRGALG